MIKVALSIISLSVLIACAKHPDEILAARVEMTTINNLDCAALASRQTSQRLKLAEEEQLQKVYWALDIALPFPPTGSVHNRDVQIGQLKGELQALREASANKGCS
ncbi:MAG: hypothetical protein Q8M31_02065 [Beijerinckiaceae bacterium]|nr:hypothetical protein [Beijerinckiaceae bacterium]